MNSLIDYVNIFFGQPWIRENWRQYLDTRGDDSPTKFTSESVIEEISLHPLLYLGADSQDIKTGIFDFNKIPNDSGNYSTLLYLGRDLMLLEAEIKARGGKIKNSLKRISEYDSTRFCILIATAYKLLGHKVEFLPEKENKMPDLLVTNGNIQFVVECKQRNQRQSDKERYEMFIKIVSSIRPLLIKKKLKDLSLEIKINVNKNNLLDEVNQEVMRSISSGSYKPIANKLFTVKFAKAHLRSHYDQFVNNPDNVNNVVYFTRAENSFLFTDPSNQNLILINKHYAEDLLPNNLYELIVDANNKSKNGNKLILHYDFGISDSDWVNIVANKIYKEISNNIIRYENIDLFVFSQTMPRNIDHQIVFKPDFKTIGRKSNLTDIPLKTLVGQQGETGMDSYLDDLDRYR